MTDTITIRGGLEPDIAGIATYGDTVLHIAEGETMEAFQARAMAAAKAAECRFVAIGGLP